MVTILYGSFMTFCEQQEYVPGFSPCDRFRDGISSVMDPLNRYSSPFEFDSLFDIVKNLVSRLSSGILIGEYDRIAPACSGSTQWCPFRPIALACCTEQCNETGMGTVFPDMAEQRLE